MTTFDPRTTALVLIDLQNGIVAMPVQPHSGPDVLAVGKALAEKFRAAKAPVVLVNVAFAPDFADAPPSNVDQPLQAPPGGLPPDWSKLVDGLAQPSDLRVTKKQWGAFTGTDLDLQLRRRGIRTIVLGGISTNIGVESTARFAWELGYDIAVVEDACTAMAAEQHKMAFGAIFPRIARVVRSADVAFAKV
jgi:nicotinamidase-related amidase